MRRTVSLVSAVAVLTVTVLSGCASEASEPTSANRSSRQDIRVGALYPERRSVSEGLTYTHNQAILSALEETGLTDDDLVIRDNISDEDDILPAIEDLAEQGCDIIFCISPDHALTVADAADEYPDIVFCSAFGAFTNDMNLINYSGRFYQLSYLDGIDAGYMSIDTQNNDIEYYFDTDTADVLDYSCINAFTLGALSVNPDVSVHVTEIEGEGIYSFERDANWEQFYVLAIRTCMDNEASDEFYSDIGGNYYGDLADGFINKESTEDTDASMAIDLASDLMISGQWDVFSGISLVFDNDSGQVVVSQIPESLYDSEGNLVVEAGQPSVSDVVIRGYMDYLIEGVIG